MFVTYIWRELRRRWRQTVLATLGLAVGVGLVVAVTSFASGVGEAQQQVLHSLYGVGTDITVTKEEKFEGGGPQRFDMNPGSRSNQGKRFSREMVRAAPGQGSMAASSVTTVASLDGVERAAGALVLHATKVDGKFAEAVDQGAPRSAGSQPRPTASQAPLEFSSFTLTGVDVSQGALGPLSGGEIVTGRTLTTADASAKVAVIGRAYAEQNNLTVGSTVTLSGAAYKVVGVVSPATSGSSSSGVFIPLKLAQQLSDNEGQVNQIFVKAQSADGIAAVKTSIKGALADTTVTTAADLAGQVSGSLKSASALATTLGVWIAVIAVVAAFTVVILLTMAAVSRRVREFGTLKALGWRTSRIVAQVMGEAFVQGVLGAVAGVLLGVAGAKLIARFSPALQASLGGAMGGPGRPGGGRAALAQAAQNVSVDLTAPISPSLILLAVGIALLGGLLAGAFGGWRAARLRPADALRKVD